MLLYFSIDFDRAYTIIFILNFMEVNFIVYLNSNYVVLHSCSTYKRPNTQEESAGFIEYLSKCMTT